METPHFYIDTLFQVYTPFLAKHFVPHPQVTQFLGGPTPIPPLIRGDRGFQVCYICQSKLYVWGLVAGEGP